MLLLAVVLVAIALAVRAGGNAARFPTPLDGERPERPHVTPSP